MITEIGAAMSGLQATKDIVKGMTIIRDAAALNTVKVHLQSSILDAQEQLFAALEKQAAMSARVVELEQEVMRLKDWSAERETYQLAQVYTGAYVYMRKAGMEAGQPPHWLCAPCYDNRKKSILQRLDAAGARPPTREWQCPSCKATISVGYRTKPGEIAVNGGE